MSKSLYQAFSLHFFNEFRSRLELDVDDTGAQGPPGLTGSIGGMMNPSMLGGGSNMNNSMLQQQMMMQNRMTGGPIGQNTTSGGMRGRNNSFGKGDVTQKFTAGDRRNTLHGIQERGSYIQEGQDQWAEQIDPRNSNAGYQNDRLQANSMIQNTFIREGASPMNQRQMRSDKVFSPSRGGNEETGGGLNMSRANMSINKSRRFNSQQTRGDQQLSRSKNFIQQSGLNTIMEQSNMIDETIQNQQQVNVTNQRRVEKDNKGYVRVGDIIVLSFSEKVYEQIAQKKEENQQNMGLAKIMQTPEFEYKGVMFSDGVTDKTFSVIPKSSNIMSDDHVQDFATYGSSLFKKCLFRIEIAQECSYHVKHQNLLNELREVELEREEVDETNDAEVEKIEEKIKIVENKIQENMEMMKEEAKNNDYEFQMNIGKKITYGQKVQLRHMFSNQFLALNNKKISQEHGCVQISLSQTNENSWFMLVPSQKIRVMGQSIAYEDSFFIQNFLSKTKFYIHVNITDIQRQRNQSILEINASHEASRLRAKLFIDYNHLLSEKNNLHSGDSIKLFHKESGGYLTAGEKEVEVMLPELPDFLQKQIRQLQGKQRKDAKGDDEEIDNKVVQQEDEKRLQKHKIYVERNKPNLYFTNSCWEIQKVNPFKGGSITWDGFYRIRHIGTGLYLAVTGDKLDLTFKQHADITDTLFRIRKDSYNPGYRTSPEEALKTGDGILLETFFRTYIQIYKQFEDEEITQFELKLSNKDQINLPSSQDSHIPLACGFFSKDDVSKMVFIVEEIPNEHALIAYQGSSFFQTFLDFYDFLNQWAVIQIEENEEAIDNMRYDPQVAIATETDLDSSVEDIKQVIQYLLDILNEAKELSRDSYIKVQKNLAEQGLLPILIKMIELIYYKTVPYEEREPAFDSNKVKKKKQEAEDNEAEIIAREYLDPLAEKILKVLHLMIKLNQHNAEKVTKYDSIIYQQLGRYDTKLIANIFKETFKRAQYIFGDKSAVITHSEGIDNKAVEQNIETTVGLQYSSSLTNQINKWTEMLNTVQLQSEHDENVSKQILYLNVISMICRDQNGKGIHHFQIQAVQNILGSEQSTPLKFGVQKRDIDRPYVYFVRKPRETGEIFFSRNPLLREVYKAPSSQAYGGDALDIIFDLQEISQKADTLMPYIDYIASVISLYSHMCLTRNQVGILKVKDVGLSYEHINTCLQNKHIHEKLKSAYIFAAKVLFVDNDPFPTLVQYKNRCYFWESLQDAHAHRTMYAWEKNKYTFPQQSRVQNQEVEMAEDVVANVKKHVNKFFKKGPSDIKEFLYGWENKRYTKKDIDPKLKLLINYMDCATSLIECEHVNSNFIQRMLEAAGLILITYHSKKIAEGVYEYWITKLLFVSKKLRACRNKIEILEYKTLQMLEVICRFRMNQQVLLFLQKFKEFEEKNDEPHINIEITKFDKEFQAFFTLHQFNVDQRSTFRKIKKLAHKEKIKNANELDDIDIQELKKQFDEDDEQEKKELDEDQENRENMVNTKIPLDEFLLYLVFSKSTNRKIRDQAIKVLVTNFNQREHLINEVVKVELMISEHDMKEYQEFRFQSFRLNGLVEQIVHDDLNYLLYQSQDKEKYKISISDVVNVLKGMTANLHNQPDRLVKKQNMLRHLDVQNDLINKLMKNIYFRTNEHFSLFAEIANFLFMFSYNNPNNQKSLLTHLNYLVTLTDKDINTPKLLTQIIQRYKDNDYGVNFMNYLINKITNNNQFKSALFKLLTVLAIDNQQNQMFILKRLVKKKRFRKRLYLDTDTNTKKIELVLALKKKMVYLAQTQLKQQKLDEDKERVDLHLATVELLAQCSKKNMFGIMQARKLISIESLFDTLLSEAVPYQFKKKYFRLLYQVYIDDVKDIPCIDINSTRFIEVMKYVVLEDLKQYVQYYTGLMLKISPEAKRDNQIEKMREKVTSDLEKLSKQQSTKMLQDKNQKEIEEYKDFKGRLSALKSNKPFPLINDTDFSEYWSYLVKFKRSQNKAEGLLIFIQDFYRNIRKTKQKLSKDLVDITIKIRDYLMQISDDLHRILETYKDYLQDIEQMLYCISQAITSIPNVRKFKAGENFNIKVGEEELKNQDQEIGSDDEDELDESKVLDIRLASEKILRITRDYIISKNIQIREAFKIDAIENDYEMKKFDLKKILKEIAGTEAQFEEIEKAIQFFTQFSKEQQVERKIMQQDMGQEGYIKPRLDPSEYSNDEFINFRDFEILLRKMLQKAGYKPPHHKREKNNDDQQLEMKMVGEELSTACNNDLKLYIKCFFDYYQRYKDADELKDTVDKIIKNFNIAFEKKTMSVITDFVQNMMKGFESGQYKLYLIRILHMILEKYMPYNYEGPEQEEQARIRLRETQSIMNDNGICALLLNLISLEEDNEIASESIKLLSSLLAESNTYVQQSLLKLMQQNQDNFQFFAYIKDRLVKSTDQLIKDIEHKYMEMAKKQQQILDNGEEENENPHRQPFYLSNQYDLENEIGKLQNRAHSKELLNIIRLIQLLCDNCFAGFQNYLRDQEEGVENRKVTSVNLVAEVANVLIKLTLKLDNKIFSDFTTYQTVPQVFSTLIDFLYGPCTPNQLILGKWRKLFKVLNMYLQQNMGFYVGSTTENKSKLNIMNLCTQLILALIDVEDPNDKKVIMSTMIKEININNLKSKLVDIYKYKIGGSQKKLRIYYSQKKCDHYNIRSIVRDNMCEKDEYCEFDNLIPFDKDIIISGFNSFMILLEMKAMFPDEETLKNFEFDIQKNLEYYNYFKREFRDLLQVEAKVTPLQLKNQIENDEKQKILEMQEKLVDSEALLQELALEGPSKKMYEEEEEEEDKGDELLDAGIDATNHGGKKQGDKGYDNDDGEFSRMNIITKRQAGKVQGRSNICSRMCCMKPKSTSSRLTRIWRLLCCCSFLSFLRRKKKQQVQAEEKVGKDKDNNEQTALLKYLDEDLDDFAVTKKSMKEQALNEEQYSYEQFKLDEAYRFYVSNISSIEIDFKGKLVKVTFMIPPYCTFLTPMSQENLIYDVKRTSQQEKLEDFFSKVKFYMAEMKTQQLLARKSRFLLWLANQWKVLSSICFSMVLLINLLFLVFYKAGQDQKVAFQYEWAEFIIEVVGIVQAILAFIVIIAYFLEYHGVIKQKCYELGIHKIEDSVTNTKGSLGYAMSAEGNENINVIEMDHEGNNTKSFVNEMKIFFQGYRVDQTHLFNTIYFIISILGVFYNQLFSILLLDVIIKIPLLTSVVQAIVQNRKQLIYTAILLFVVIYIYAYIAFAVFRDEYISSDLSDQSPDFNTYCDTLLSCFTSTLNVGLRNGGGIGDAIEQLERTNSLYWPRFVFDLSFFLIVIILMLNLIFGIIIDAFADMRDNRNFIEEDISDKCFICGLKRFDFEIKNKSWFDHIKRDHNVYAYLYFILYVLKKPMNECNGVEKHVKEKIKQDDITFFPINKCLAFSGLEDDSRNSLNLDKHEI